MLDRITLFATAAFVNVKFMPLFAMLFGAGFSLLYEKLKTMTTEPRRIYRRRMLFLFVFGVLHGMFFYFGDITQMYAVAGLVLLLYVDRDVGGVGRAARNWWIGMAVFTALTFALVGPALTLPPEQVAAVQSNIEVFSRGSYIEQLPVRISEFGDLIIGNFFGLPLTVALMLTGMLAQRAGWLQQRDARAWRTASTLGLLIGLPAALLYGYWLLSDVEAYGLAATPHAATVPMLLGICLSFLYASVFLRRAPPGLIALLAPAGRMPLTNYLFQSIAMGALLSGWGLALGPRLNYCANGPGGGCNRRVPDRAEPVLVWPDEDEAGPFGSAMARLDVSRPVERSTRLKPQADFDRVSGRRVVCRHPLRRSH